MRRPYWLPNLARPGPDERWARMYSRARAAGGGSVSENIVEDHAAAPLRVEDRRLITEAIEINAAWHCNISCRWCSHASPASVQRFADPERVRTSLTKLAHWMRLDHVRILGGEPLLHPRLIDLMRSAIDSRISDKVRVLTNGLVLHEAPAEFWQTVNEVHVSVYPSTTRAVERHVDVLRERAKRSHTRLRFLYFDQFRISYRPSGDDEALTARVYRTCQVGNVWRCLTLEDTRLFRCPQAAHVNIAPEYAAYRSHHGLDFLEINAISSPEALLAWLRGRQALTSCQVCAGSVGTLQPHQQILRRRFETDLPEIDRTYLELLEANPTASNSCVGREVTVWEPR